MAAETVEFNKPEVLYHTAAVKAVRAWGNHEMPHISLDPADCDAVVKASVLDCLWCKWYAKDFNAAPCFKNRWGT